MEEMRARIDRGDTEREIEDIIQVSHVHELRRREEFLSCRQGMVDIAKDRAKKLSD
jgi:hypothetical protein